MSRNIDRPSVRAVIFDMDGVLFNSEPEYMCQMARMMAQEGYPVSRQALLATIGTSMEETCRILKEDSSAPHTIAQLLEAYEHWAPDNPIPYAEVMESDAPPVLLELKRRGYRLGLASSSDRGSIEGALVSSGLRDLLICSVSSDDISHKKPHPECYLLAARLLGVSPECCLTVEDTKVGLMAATAAGTVALGRTREYQQDLSLARGVVHSLSQLLDWAPPLAEADVY